VRHPCALAALLVSSASCFAQACKDLAGDALGQLLDKLGIRQQMEGKAARIPATPVGGIIAHGQADLGCQQRSELKPVQGIDIVGLIPQEVQLETQFSGAVVRGASHPEAAGRLLRFLAAPANARTIEATGLEPVAAPH
jgi:molybdate transport system substrate-binding protein